MSRSSLPYKPFPPLQKPSTISNRCIPHVARAPGRLHPLTSLFRRTHKNSLYDRLWMATVRTQGRWEIVLCRRGSLSGPASATLCPTPARSLLSRCSCLLDLPRVLSIPVQKLAVTVAFWYGRQSWHPEEHAGRPIGRPVGSSRQPQRQARSFDLHDPARAYQTWRSRELDDSLPRLVSHLGFLHGLECIGCLSLGLCFSKLGQHHSKF